MPTSSTVAYREGDQDFDAVIVRPDGEGPHPAVLICHAWGGRGELDIDKAQKLAELGYASRILVLHGQDDPMVPPADIGPFAEEMKRIDADWQLHAYPGVMHAFTNPNANDPDFGTVYDEDAAQRSWAEMKRFFAELLA